MLSVVDDDSRVVLRDYGPEYDYINASNISVIIVNLLINYIRLHSYYLLIFKHIE